MTCVLWSLTLAVRHFHDVITRTYNNGPAADFHNACVVYS